MFKHSFAAAYLLALLVAVVAALGYAGCAMIEFARLDWAWPQYPAVLERATAGFLRIAPSLAIITIGWIALSLALNGSLIAAVSGARPAAPGRHPRAEAMLASLARQAGMPVPRLAVIDTGAMNAYASGLHTSDYTVTLTTGLMLHLSDDELEGVIAHELAHIRHRDVRLLMIAAAVTGGIALACEAVYLLAAHGIRIATTGSLVDDENPLSSYWVAIVIFLPLAVLAFVVSQLISLGISRRREFMADAEAAKLTANPAALISALQKISQHCDIGAPSGVMRMCIEAPPALFDLLSTHPSTEHRIEALRRLSSVATKQNRRGASASPNRSAGFGRRRATSGR